MLYRKLAIVPCVLLACTVAFIAVRTVQVNNASDKFDRAVELSISTPADPISAPVLIKNIKDATDELRELREQRTYGYYAIAPLALAALVLFLLARKEARDAKALDLA